MWYNGSSRRTESFPPAFQTHTETNPLSHGCRPNDAHLRWWRCGVVCLSMPHWCPAWLWLTVLCLNTIYWARFLLSPALPNLLGSASQISRHLFQPICICTSVLWQRCIYTSRHPLGPTDELLIGFSDGGSGLWYLRKAGGMAGWHRRRQTEQLLADGDLQDEPLSTSDLVLCFKQTYSPLRWFTGSSPTSKNHSYNDGVVYSSCAKSKVGSFREKFACHFFFITEFSAEQSSLNANASLSSV